MRVRFELTCGKKPDAQSANVVGEVVGRERPEEIVLLGAHLDSWDLGTGAIDDGAGCGIVIETARQIAALSPHPRRTIRVVLFANEENGLAGGKAYVKAHEAELQRHVAALEADAGQGPPIGLSWNAGPSAEAMLKTITGIIGTLGAGQLKPGESGGADISQMLPAGVPSLGLLQDSTTYFDLHHTANDTLDKIDPAILDRSTAAAAVTAYVLAEIPETLERIPSAKRDLRAGLIPRRAAAAVFGAWLAAAARPRRWTPPKRIGSQPSRSPVSIANSRTSPSRSSRAPTTSGRRASFTRPSSAATTGILRSTATGCWRAS